MLTPQQRQEKDEQLLQRVRLLAAEEPNLKLTYEGFAERLQVGMCTLWKTFRRARCSLTAYLTSSGNINEVDRSRRKKRLLNEDDDDDKAEPDSSGVDGDDSDEEIR